MAKDSLSDVAGLPDELGLDEAFAQEQQQLTVRVESRRYGKPMTIVEGFDDDLTSASDLKELASDLKKAVGAGGTVTEGHIEIQGDQTERVREILADRGYSVTG
ncbi:stress response translation initiation inhibitor YciH [Salinirubellus salinus]|uniref:Stress response translation initiation inhibitor YciH n=1 Tax=Salinirubellus salinus TaxID=1364945 RepID=A0A9E7R0Z7_9EURY|nr:stress response translation initiation inhibitor YciH [Salinirubellus salinus]UWM53637.1 stress response translation initiation inhibitor YciH [Salinirubellus salinus]